MIVPMQHQLRLEHITSLADAIFAFSITFMAITIDIINLAQNLTQAQVIEFKCPKKYILFTSEEGAEDHYHIAALSLANQRIFDWLDDVVLQKQSY